MTPFPLAGSADALLEKLRDYLPALPGLTGHQLMAERSVLSRLSFQPGIAPGGTCRLLATADSPIALNLPRDSDWELLPALFETRDPELCRPGNWAAVTNRLAGQTDALSLVQRARQLGLAASVTGDLLTPTHVFKPDEFSISRHRDGIPLVVDLSALWAGPLASHLLWLGGARVIKVESISRPDGAREGSANFYNLLNQGKQSIALDFATAEGRDSLLALLRAADIVIEAARPRALRQLGIHAEAMVESQPGKTWISITGYGRQDPAGNWIAYGDDAGVAAGLADLMFQATGAWSFAGDAIADPLTGINTALAAMHGWHSGDGGLQSIALAHVAAWAVHHELELCGREKLLGSLADWWQSVCTAGPDAARRPITARTEALGESNHTLLASPGLSCC